MSQSREQFSEYPTDGTFQEGRCPDIVAWKLTRSAIEHENVLINHRITWLLQSQGFLLAVFGVLYSLWVKGDLREHITQVMIAMSVIAVFAIYLSLVIQLAVARANESLDELTVHFMKLVKEHGFKRTPPLHYWRKPFFLLDQQDVPAAVMLLWLVIVSTFLVPALGSRKAVGMLIVASGGLTLFMVRSVIQRIARYKRQYDRPKHRS